MRGIATRIRKFEIDPEVWKNNPRGSHREWFEALPLNVRLFELVEWPDRVKEGGIRDKKGELEEYRRAVCGS